MAHSSIRNHLKLFALSDALEVSKATALGHLELFWHAVYESPGVGLDGRLTGWTARHIDRMAEWTGNSSFADAAVKAGFLERDDDVFIVHDYDDWVPAYVKKRIDRRANPDGDADRTPNGKPCGRRTDSTRTPKQPKATQPKPKQNDAKKKKPTPSNPTASHESLPVATIPESGGNGVLHIPANGKDGGNGAIPPQSFERKFANQIGPALGLDGETLEKERHFLEGMGTRFIGLPDYAAKALEAWYLAKAKVQAVKEGKLDRAFGAWVDDMEKKKFPAWELETQIDQQPVEVA